MHTLLLWDIDGTLTASGGAGERALAVALRTAFGLDGSMEDIELAGRTDRWIARRVLAKFGLPEDDATATRFLDAYLSALPGELTRRQARTLPGVRAALEATRARAGFAQGLLTGNLRRGAEIKLGHHGLWDFFPFGAFADDAERRNDLGPHALRRAQAHHGVAFAPDRVWIVGDTPHDIACARAIGARAVAVATGGFSADQLAAHAPDAVLPDLSDASALFRLLA